MLKYGVLSLLETVMDFCFGEVGFKGELARLIDFSGVLVGLNWYILNSSSVSKNNKKKKRAKYPSVAALIFLFGFGFDFGWVRVGFVPKQAVQESH